MDSVLHVPGALGPVSSISQRVPTVLSHRSASLPTLEMRCRASVVLSSSLGRSDSAVTLSTPSGPERLRGRLSVIPPLTHPGYRGGHLRPLQITYIL